MNYLSDNDILNLFHSCISNQEEYNFLIFTINKLKKININAYNYDKIKMIYIKELIYKMLDMPGFIVYDEKNHHLHIQASLLYRILTI